MPSGPAGRPDRGPTTVRGRPSAADRPDGRPAAAAAADVVPEVMSVSEWLSHELQMAHPYSRTAVLDLVETSLVLNGRLSDAGPVAGRADRLPAGPDPGRPARHLPDRGGAHRGGHGAPEGAGADPRRAGHRGPLRPHEGRRPGTAPPPGPGPDAPPTCGPVEDGMARLYADLPLPVAAACVDAIGAYAHTHQNDGDDRPIGQIRTEVLTDLILRPWDTTRPTVTAEVTIHLTIPTLTGGPSTVGLDDYAEAEVDGQTISAAQCRELLTQLDSSRLFLALHNPDSGACAPSRRTANSAAPPAAGGSAARRPLAVRTVTAARRSRTPTGRVCGHQRILRTTGPPAPRTATSGPGTGAAGISAAPAKPSTATERDGPAHRVSWVPAASRAFSRSSA